MMKNNFTRFRVSLFATWIMVLFAGQVVRAQLIPIGIIDFYGQGNIDSLELRKAIRISEGDSIHLDKLTKPDLEKDLKTVHGVKRAKVTFVCCDSNGHWMLFAGVSTKFRSDFIYNLKPERKGSLPVEIMNTQRAWETANGEAVKKNDATEDDTQGHALATNPTVRAYQEKFIGFAAEDRYLPALKLVLRTSVYAKQRAVAAQVIAYAKNKNDVLADLSYALHDQDEEVRNNAARALSVMATYANLNPALGLQIPTVPFIQMVNSLVWTDRNKGISALMPLTQSRDSILLKQLKVLALPSITEMAKWKSSGHAYPAYLILGRIAGYPDDKVTDSFYKGDKDAFLKEMLDKITSG